MQSQPSPLPSLVHACGSDQRSATAPRGSAQQRPHGGEVRAWTVAPRRKLGRAREIWPGVGARARGSGSLVGLGMEFSLTLFKFAVLFKIWCTIQIRNMNSARALTREWIRHPNLLLFKALLCLYGGWSTRWFMVIMRGWWSAWLLWPWLAEYGYACDSQDLWQACEAKGSAGVGAAGCVCPTRYSLYALQVCFRSS